jgi:hypothetical protein
VRARLDLVAGPDRDAALFEVAVLGDPAISVLDQHAVAALAVGDIWIPRCVDPVGDPVPGSGHDAVGSRDNPNALLHVPQRWHANISAVMAVIGLAAAAVIRGFGPGEVINILLDGAIQTRRASYRQTEFYRAGNAGLRSKRQEQTRTAANRALNAFCNRFGE